MQGSFFNSTTTLQYVEIMTRDLWTRDGLFLAWHAARTSCAVSLTCLSDVCFRHWWLDASPEHVKYHVPGSSTSASTVCVTECRTFLPRIYSPRTFPPPGQFPSPSVKAKIWKLALTNTPDPNRSTAINFVNVNGISLYIVYWRMVVVEGGNVLHRVKRREIVREGKCPGRGICPGGIYPLGNVRVPRYKEELWRWRTVVVRDGLTDWDGTRPMSCSDIVAQW